MGLLRRAMGVERFDGITGRRQLRAIWICRPQLRRLDEARTARRPHPTHIRWAGFAESVYRRMEKGLEQLRPRDRICVAGAMVRRWTDHHPRRLSSEFPA